MNIISYTQNIENFLEKNTELANEAAVSRDECAVETAENLKNLIDEISNSNRLLKIGVIGRVKAGKSSLLNALLFKGQDLLPKAATPMTAALTVISYSDTVQAEVDFFSQKDIDDIHQKSNEYEEALNIRIEEETKIIKEQEAKRKLGKSKLTNAELLERAEKKAKRELSEHPYAGAYDQSQRIKNSGIKNIKSLNAYKHIKANSIDDLLNGKLNDFVGHDGKYMPFTKSVQIYMPHEGLKGLEVVDTPGINDPVQSREKRTHDLLAQCDVVFMVSPAGQFLSREDTDLLTRVTELEGTKQAYIIASQADNQLYGSEKEGLTNINDVIRRITENLTKQARHVLDGQAKSIPALAEVMNKISQNPIICSSGIAYSILQRYEQPNQWDENMQHVNGMLKHHYPDYFNTPAAAKHTLENLANISKVQAVLQEVKNNKQKILEEKREETIKAKTKGLEVYSQKIDAIIKSKINELKSSDISEVKRKLKSLKENSENMKYYIDDSYKDLLDSLSHELSSQLSSTIQRETSGLNENQARGSELVEETYRVKIEKSFIGKILSIFSSGGESYETKTRTVNKEFVRAGIIANEIKKIRTAVDGKSNDSAYSIIEGWKKKINHSIIEAIRKAEENTPPESRLTTAQIDKAVSQAKRAINIPKFDLPELPDDLNKAGNLYGREGGRFIEAAYKYVTELQNMLLQDAKNQIESLIDRLGDVNLSKKFIEHLEKDANSLSEQLESKELYLAKYQKMAADFSKIK